MSGFEYIETGGAPIKAWTRGVSIEDAARRQIENVARLPFIHKHVAVMPDVHWGMGATVGSVIPTVGAIIPAAVGAAWDRLKDRYAEILEQHPKAGHPRALGHLGTLGTGNHFIELCLDEEDRLWVMLHSGSRGPGNKLGTYFIELAKKEMRRWFVNLPDEDLAYLPESTEHFGAYVRAVGWAQGYARVNRELMMEAILEVLRRSFPDLATGGMAVNCHHNYVVKEQHFGKDVWLTRKGAVRARAGELGIIPGSMGAKSFIVRGKGNADSFETCSHGAGRAMSRNEAKRRFTLADHACATAHVECRKDEGVLDETPGAYKDIDAVMAAQADLVEIVHTLRQVVCVKG